VHRINLTYSLSQSISLPSQLEPAKTRFWTRACIPSFHSSSLRRPHSSPSISTTILQLCSIPRLELPSYVAPQRRTGEAAWEGTYRVYTGHRSTKWQTYDFQYQWGVSYPESLKGGSILTYCRNNTVHRISPHTDDPNCNSNHITL
jgi:hypothetical protein